MTMKPCADHILSTRYVMFFISQWNNEDRILVRRLVQRDATSYSLKQQEADGHQSEIDNQRPNVISIVRSFRNKLTINTHDSIRNPYKYSDPDSGGPENHEVTNTFPVYCYNCVSFSIHLTERKRSMRNGFLTHT